VLSGCSDSDYRGPSNPPDAGTPNPPTSTPTDNTAVVTRSTGGTIATASGGTRMLSLTFNSSDTNDLTNLTVTTDLARLPAGWSAAENFQCATVSTGSGCLLNLTYSPTAAAGGSFDITYSYTNAVGTTKSGREAIAYLATTNNNVVATGAPSGQVTAVVGDASQSVSITFTTDDGLSASQLHLTTALDSLPSGWSAANSAFACETVGTGNGCQLTLTYAPAAVSRGTLTLRYEYLDNSGTAKSSSLNIAYAATIHNNVVGTFTPSGQVAAVIGGGRQNVTVSFAPNDGNAASAFALTTDLSTLPSGWSSSVNALTCSEVSTGTACELPLEFAPSTVGSGTLTLAYSYRDNAGETKTGSVNIPYVSTSNNNVVATGNQTRVEVRKGETGTLTVTFTTDDGQPATDLSITSGLDPLPTYWTSDAADFDCASVSTGTGCRLILTYSPLVSETQTLVLGFAYTDNSGAAKTGTFSIVYTSWSYVLYVSHQDKDYVSKCTLEIDGSAQACETTGTDMQLTSDITSRGQRLYTSAASGAYFGSHLRMSELDGWGGVGMSYITPGVGTNLMTVAVNPVLDYIYTHDTSTGLLKCSLIDGWPDTDCAVLADVPEFTKLVFSANGSLAYGSYANTSGNWSTKACWVSGFGSLGYCSDTGTNTEYASTPLQIAGGRLYFLSNAGGFVVCPIENGGMLGTCQNTANSELPMRATFTPKFAYLTTSDSYLRRCPILVDGTLGACTNMTDPSFGVTLGIHVR
jgi:hypothetical protein